MSRKSQSQSFTKQREPDDLKEGERTAQVGRRDRGEYEDVEDVRAKARRDGDDVVEEIDDEDIVEVSDLEPTGMRDGE